MPAPLSQYAATEKPVLYIEVKLVNPAKESENQHTNTVRHEVLQWLDATFQQVQIGEHLSLRFLSCAEQVSSVQVTGRSIPDTEKLYHRIGDHNLDVTVFSLSQDQHDGASSCSDGEEDSPFFTVTQLPHQDLDGRWESLIYSEPVPDNILRVLTEMIEISSHANLNAAIISWYSIVLLHGPPGSGKTTLAESLAQKLSIRMRHMFSVAKLFHLKCSTLFSSYFSESSKQIGKLFDIIWDKASDKSFLTVVIIDEVETLASSRQRATQANEAMDSMRATNELLRGLDRLHKRPNVVFLCTSNLKECLDSAFLDRCAIDQFIDVPSTESRYEIFRSIINELMNKSIVVKDDSMAQQRTCRSVQSSPTLTPPAMQPSSSPPTQHLPARSSSFHEIPSLAIAQLYLRDQPSAIPWKLLQIARMAEGLSGRTLRKLPMLALTKYTFRKPRRICDLLDALRKAVCECEDSAGEVADLSHEQPDITPPGSDSDQDSVDPENNDPAAQQLRSEEIYRALCAPLDD